MSEPATTPPAYSNVERWAHYLLLAGCSLAAAGLLVPYVRYLASGSYVDHIEATATILGYNYLHGHPLYEFQDGVLRYSSLYGPFAYLIQSVGIWLFGPHIWSAKLFSGLAMTVTMIVLVRHFSRGAAFWMSAWVLAYLFGGLAYYHRVAFWIRPEPFITMLVALAVVMAHGKRPAVAVGLCIGLAVNFKFHAAWFCVPVIIDVLIRRGWRDFIVLSVVAASTSLLPFALPGVDLWDYVNAVGQQAREREPLDFLVVLAVWAMLLFCLPIILVLMSEKRQRPWEDRVFIWATLGTIALLAYPASLAGAGAYHFMPLVPVLTAAYARAAPRRLAGWLVPGIILLPALILAVPNIWRSGPAPFPQTTADEVLTLARDPVYQPLEIGFGDDIHNYPSVQVSRTIATLAGYPPVIDAQVLMELDVIGIDGTKRWIPLLQQCQVKSWLIPTGETPFAMRGYYHPGPLFGAAFRAAFPENYQFVRKTGFFDLWQCRHQKGG